ncbi:glycine/sarcosine/betaine reductase selenoprotein B family protein [Erysipelothrix rhusiopathiae]|uniref:GrdB-related putative oxidoreductase n=1 Tax=Erysipelothrix rhusiopathiae TaxID=1648 RepID=UPI0023AF3E96|nr:glycine/sarcosine/betaine reductase selenoprotein B family protein [Erysipelothrix rhusiopathiae]MDE8042760.1 glycine/sarcosine/betaine reductase selenoprotein B family protein [Erysipelothrix rhusiopathiae]MDE8049627.1 glycine/sarcosine/betaine reductase selenoprotein B family protein [Erysipelothrix rhusiopathiae]MDE8059004.1 glycine/sarcosine/betaine reductase selenoprotein B family protein [Erysipelothrix rhusiopathiae]MDE8066132.1 glycine/sarcosine/betaine reductase selenoprotein B fami
MRVLLFFDQTQAGAGGKERPNVELAVEKGGIGSYHMFEKYIKQEGGLVLATMYCGNGYFFDHEEEVKRKVAGLATKLKADIVLCGPCFDYPDYSRMSAILAQYIEENTDTKAVAMFSKENEEVIEQYKDSVRIIKMPRKGGTGLNVSLENMSKVLKAVVEDQPKSSYESFIY